MQQQNKVIWIVVLTIILIARFALGLSMIENQEMAIMPDSPSYLEVATYWDQNGVLRSSGTDADLMRTPGYPLLLWLIMQLPVDLVITTVIVQLFMGVLIAWLVFRILQPHFSSDTAALGAAFVLLSPNLFLWSVAIHTDVLFTLLLILSVYCLLKLTISPNSKSALVSGLVLSAATLVRPIGLLLIPTWGLIVFVSRWLHPSWKIRAQWAIFALLSGLILITPWMIRNAVVWDRATLSPISTWNLGHYQAAGAVAHAEGISLEEARTRFTITRPPIPGDGVRYMKIILENLDDYIYIHVQGTKTIIIEASRPYFDRLMGDRYRGSGVFSALSRLRFSEAAVQLDSLRDNKIQFQLFLLNAAAQIGLATIYFLSIVGGITLIRKQNPQIRLLLLLIAACFILLILTPGPVGNDRFRVPFEPYMALLAAAGLSALLKLQSQWRASRTDRKPDTNTLKG